MECQSEKRSQKWCPGERTQAQKGQGLLQGHTGNLQLPFYLSWLPLWYPGSLPVLFSVTYGHSLTLQASQISEQSRHTYSLKPYLKRWVSDYSFACKMELFQRVLVAPSGERLGSKQQHRQPQWRLARAKPWVSAGGEVGRLCRLHLCHLFNPEHEAELSESPLALPTKTDPRRAVTIWQPSQA